jgi:hypothetical protein
MSPVTPRQQRGQGKLRAIDKRTYCISVRVNAAEHAELERRRGLAGTREIGAYVRTAVLSTGTPRLLVPEVNRAAWVELIAHLARMQELGGRLDELTDRQPRGLAGMLGRGRLEETLVALAAELRAVRAEIQALRRGLLASER